MADLVNIAGKRSSLAYLNHQLSAIPGVIDGAFFLRDERQASVTGVTRVAAVVVAPGLDSHSLVSLLRARIDPVFLPRPLLFVDKLPRNDTGKLPQQALLSLVNDAMQRVCSGVAPACASSPRSRFRWIIRPLRVTFPGAPILPGVVLLDVALREIELAGTQPAQAGRSLRRNSTVRSRPASRLTLERETMPDGSIRFAIHCTGRIVASGVFTAVLSAAGVWDGGQDRRPPCRDARDAGAVGHAARTWQHDAAKTMSRVSLRLGRPASRCILYIIAAYYFAFAPTARRHSRDYLRRALGREPRRADRFRHLDEFRIHDSRPRLSGQWALRSVRHFYCR